MNAKHTPTPWELGTGHKIAKDHAICSGPIIIAAIKGNGYPIGEGWSETSAADAAHIVRCVNTHEELVAVARGALGYLEALPKEYRPDEQWFSPLRAILAKVK